jgi:2OG-Fe(II) oxygenase superfamily
MTTTMAKKKRKSTIHTTVQSNNDNGEKSTQNELGSASSSAKKMPFKSFPLHLIQPELQDDNDPQRLSSKPHAVTLTELCMGRVWVIPSFFSFYECRSWVEFCESTSSLHESYTLNPATSYTAHRECYRLQQHDATTLASRVFDRLKSTWVDNNNTINNQNGTESVLDRLMLDAADIYGNHHGGRHLQPVGCNPNFRVYKYTRGHSFGRHIDESNNVPGVGKTAMTILIYLSDCSGGATRFYTEKDNIIDDKTGGTGGRGGKGGGSGKTKAERRQQQNVYSSSSSPSFAFQPCIGSMLLHVHGEHCLEHEAEPVQDGIKYVLRTDLVFG